MKFKIEVCRGQAGLALYVNDTRVDGVRDNGLMTVVLSHELLVKSECVDCDGTGKYPTGATCKSCGGEGVVDE